MQVLDTYVSHPPLPQTDTEGPDYVKKTPLTGAGGSSSSAGARPVSVTPVVTLASPDKLQKRTIGRRRQYVGDQDDDEEITAADAGQPAPATSNRPSDRPEPLSPTQRSTEEVVQTGKTDQSSQNRKETDFQSTSSKKRLCRIKLKKALRFNL